MTKRTFLKNTALLLVLVLLFSGCKTYYIPVDRFKQQFEGMDSSKMKDVVTRGPMGGLVKYKIYPIDYIKCVDKNDKPVVLKNGPSIEMRITDVHNKRTIFYFDLIRVDESSILGVESRFMPSIKKRIPLNEIKFVVN